MTYEEKLQKIQQLQELLAVQTQQIQELQFLSTPQPAHTPTDFSQMSNVPANPNMPMGWEQQQGVPMEQIAGQLNPVQGDFAGNVARDALRFVPQQAQFAQELLNDPLAAAKGLGQFVGGGMNMAMQYSPLGNPNIGQRMANQAQTAQQFQDRPIETLAEITAPVGIAKGAGEYVGKGRAKFEAMRERARAAKTQEVSQEALTEPPPAPSPEVVTEIARKRAEKAGQEYTPEPASVSRETLPQPVEVAKETQFEKVTPETPQVVKDIAAKDQWGQMKEREAQGLSKAEQDRLRAETQEIAKAAQMPEEITRRLDELPEHQKRPFIESARYAKEQGLDQKALQIADEIVGSKRPRPITDAEYMGLTYKAVDLKKEYNSTMKTISEMQDRGDVNAAALEMDKAEMLMGNIDKVTNAARLGRREVARALSIGRVMLDMETYDLATTTQYARAAKGGKLTPKESAKIKQVTEAYAEAQKKLEEQQKLLDAYEAQQAKRIAERVAEIEAKQFKIAKGKTRRIAKAKDDQLLAEKELAKLGFRMNDITGVTAEGAYWIGRWSVAKIRQGAASLEAVVKEAKAKFPELSDKDVWDALNTRDPKRVAKARSETERRVSEIKTTAGLLSKIADAEQGIFMKPEPKAATNVGIQLLRKQLNELRTKAYKTVADPIKLDKAQQTINELQDMLANQYRNIKAKKPTPPDELLQAREKIKELKRQMYVEDQLADLNQQLATGEFKIKPMRSMKTRPPEIERNEVNLNIARKKVRQTISEMRPWTTGRVALESANTLRTMKATADMSAVLRQGLITTISHPVYAATQAFPKSVKAFFSKYTAEQIDSALRSVDHHYMREKAKLHLSDLDSPKPSAREEYFMSNVLKKVPGVKQVVAASERHMTTYLNMIRANAFDQVLAKYPNATHAELELWAKWINVSTGRGTWAPEMMNKLSGVFFAPRFAMSRIQVPVEAGKAMYDVAFGKKLPRISKEIAKDVVKLAVTGGIALGLAKMGGADVSLDPTSADFGKIKVGSTRYDIWGGMQQPMRVVLQLSTGKSDKIDPVDLISRFVSYKLAPSVTVPMELYRGKTLVGEKRTPLETLGHLFMPMFVEDVKDAWKLEGVGAAGAAGTAAFFGLGANTYVGSKTRVKAEIRKLQLQGDYEGVSKLRQQWKIEHPGEPLN